MAAGVALFISAIIIIALSRQSTVKKLQKQLFVFSVALLVCAIISNFLIYIAIGEPHFKETVVYAKKVQAIFDILFAVFIGAFVVVTSAPRINTGKDFVRYLSREFPSSYLFYVAIMVVGIIGVILTPAKVNILGPKSYTFDFPLWFLLTLFTVDMAVIVYISYNLIAYLGKSRPGAAVVRETYLILLGLLGYTVSEFVFEVALPSMSVDVRSVGFILEISLVGLVAFAIREPQFLQSLLDPQPEAELQTDKTFNLETGFGYIVVGENANKGFEIFKDLVTHGYLGLCISRLPPNRVRDTYGFKRTPILWLSRIASEKTAIRPTHLERIAITIEQFVSSDKKSAVLLDGVEYMIAHNDFNSALLLLHDLNETVAMHDSILIIPIDPTTMNEREFALLKRDFLLIDSQSIANAGKRPVGRPSELEVGKRYTALGEKSEILNLYWSTVEHFGGV